MLKCAWLVNSHSWGVTASLFLIFFCHFRNSASTQTSRLLNNCRLWFAACSAFWHHRCGSVPVFDTQGQLSFLPLSFSHFSCTHTCSISFYIVSFFSKRTGTFVRGKWSVIISVYAGNMTFLNEPFISKSFQISVIDCTVVCLLGTAIFEMLISFSRNVCWVFSRHNIASKFNTVVKLIFSTKILLFYLTE